MAATAVRAPAIVVIKGTCRAVAAARQRPSWEAGPVRIGVLISRSSVPLSIKFLRNGAPLDSAYFETSVASMPASARVLRVPAVEAKTASSQDAVLVRVRTEFDGQNSTVPILSEGKCTTRRAFLRTATAGVLAVASDLTFLSRLPHVSADDAELKPTLVQFDESIDRPAMI